MSSNRLDSPAGYRRAFDAGANAGRRVPTTGRRRGTNNPDLAKEQEERLRRIQHEKKAQYKASAKAKEREKVARQLEKEERSYASTLIAIQLI